MTQDQESERLREDRELNSWKKFGPYLSERQWGTVREDYSEYGSAWEFFPHDHARSRAYRWGEDGIAGWSDDQQLMCFAIALWNGKDTILKERLFGLTGNEGNHSEDVKELYYYLDSTPTHSYMKMLYKYPQQEFPYSDLVIENAKRNKSEKEYELQDTGIFDKKEYFDITIEYAKSQPEETLILITVHNHADTEAFIHLLPTIWYRNTWAWGYDLYKPLLKLENGAIDAYHKLVGEYELLTDKETAALFCDNDTNAERIYQARRLTPYVKDGIANFVLHGAQEAVNPAQMGTKASFHICDSFAPHISKSYRLILKPKASQLTFESFDKLFRQRRAEVDVFYHPLHKGLSPQHINIYRQSLAGMMWGKQFYNFNVNQWLNGDPGCTPPPDIRSAGRNSKWQHLESHDIISMPDKWEYPWFAAWDSAFHCIPIALVDSDFAKAQLAMFLNEKYMGDHGQIPAYEWAFGDVNPPVHAAGCWRVFEIDKKKNGVGDDDFLQSIFPKLCTNFDWWVLNQRRSDAYIFGGGFLGLDNVSVIDRGAPLPDNAWLEQVDATAWMAKFALSMLKISIELSQTHDNYEKHVCRFLEVFINISISINSTDGGLWHQHTNAYHDVIRFPDHRRKPITVMNLVHLMSIIPLDAIPLEKLQKSPGLFEKVKETISALQGELYVKYNETHMLCCMTGEQRLHEIVKTMTDEQHFLGKYGIRSLSAIYQSQPFDFNLNGTLYSLKYKPEESDTYDFGENSNWRGPVWLPVNYMLLQSLLQYDIWDNSPGYKAVAKDIVNRILDIFVEEDQMRPVYGSNSLLNRDIEFRKHILFYEYFNPDTGLGCGASHQTGWTGLVADLMNLLK